MEPAKTKIGNETYGPRFVVRTVIADANEASFLPEGMNEYFFNRAHDFKRGDKVKIIIQHYRDDDDVRADSNH